MLICEWQLLSSLARSQYCKNKPRLPKIITHIEWCCNPVPRTANNCCVCLIIYAFDLFTSSSSLQNTASRRTPRPIKSSILLFKELSCFEDATTRSKNFERKWASRQRSSLSVWERHPFSDNLSDWDSASVKPRKILNLNRAATHLMRKSYLIRIVNGIEFNISWLSSIFVNTGLLRRWSCVYWIKYCSINSSLLTTGCSVQFNLIQDIHIIQLSIQLIYWSITNSISLSWFWLFCIVKLSILLKIQARTRIVL
jgi:hypothetical protein